MSFPNKGQADYLALGDWNARCSMCGAKFKASQLVRNWQGMMRCKRCNEPRHPQDFVRGIPDIQTPPWTQPLDTPVYMTGEALLTEASDTTLGIFVYIITEDSNLLTAES